MQLLSKLLKLIKSKKSQSLTSVEENQNNQLFSTDEKQIVERQEIEETPFHIVGNKEHGYFIALGRYRITETFREKREAVAELTHRKWKVITNLISTLIEANEEFSKNKAV